MNVKRKLFVTNCCYLFTFIYSELEFYLAATTEKAATIMVIISIYIKNDEATYITI